MKKDRLTGIVLCLASALFLYLSWTLPKPIRASAVGPEVFPTMAAGGLLLCSIALILKRGEGDRKEEPFLDRRGWTRVAKLFGLLAAFPLLFHYLGFAVAALAFLSLMIRLFDIDREVSLWKTALVSIAVTASLFLLFSYVLKIQLPSGVALDLIKV